MIFPKNIFMRFYSSFSFFTLVVCLLCAPIIYAQQTNPVDRQVTNPITDTPSVNPLENENLLPPPKAKKDFPNSDELNVEYERISVSGPENARVFVYTGNVDAKLGIYRLQADKVTVYEATNRIVAEGSVVFDQGNDQRITGTRTEWNYATKLGYFENSTGFTNQTADGTVIYFTADRVERVSLNKILITNGKVTACGDDLVPKWSFTAKKIEITADDRVKLKRPTFRVLDLPILPLPYASIPIKKRERASGFLTPTFGAGGDKGFRVSTAYYQTLGKSADVTLRTDVYASRGLGFGFDARTRASERSYLNFGFFAVKDRIFGGGGADKPNQGGTSVYAEGIQYFRNGFTAAVDVRLTSNLAFRQVFSDRIQQIISPIEVSQIFINKSWNNYSLDFLARSQVISLPDVRISTRNLPSVYFEKRPSLLGFTKDFPVYFSFRSSLEGVSRRETSEAAAQTSVSNQIQRTPALGQRLDFNPQIEIPLYYKGFSLTTTAGLRSTFYSDSQDFATRQVNGKNLLRGYGELEFDFRPPALAKNFYEKDGLFRFRHVIEPYLAFRLRTGIGQDFRRTILFDYNDTVTDTNEIEYGLTNRFYVRRYTEIPAEGVSRDALRKISKNPTTPLSIQPYEIFTLTVRGKYFGDPYFGGALVPGQRNQLRSFTDLTAFTFGGVPRRFSPLNIDSTYRPRRTIFVNTRMDLGIQNVGLRDLSATVGYDTRLLKIFQTFYYTRAIDLVPSLERYSDAFGKEPGTRRGSQWSPTLFAGNRERGFYGGASLFFDFQNRRALKASPLISSTLTLGYAFDCCAVTLQYSSFNVGLRNENRVLFSFRLNGIGAFGTEQFGQGLR
ncbi:MAG: LPS assembly protein LptD [Pyrinomonadaceae bacterium]